MPRGGTHNDESRSATVYCCNAKALYSGLFSDEILQKIRAGLKQAQSVAEAEALIRGYANFLA